MHIEKYHEKYNLDIIYLAQKFYDDTLNELGGTFQPSAVLDMIVKLSKDNTENAFLLVDDNKCRGLIAGMGIQSFYDDKKIWQEIIWYVDKEYRKDGVLLLRHAEEMLKAKGYNTIIMALLANSKADIIRKLYKRMGYRQFEEHYIRSI